LWSGDLAIEATDHLKSDLIIFGAIATSATNHFQNTCNFASDIATSATDYLSPQNRGNESSIYFVCVGM
jgi:hypothetical protein